MLHVEHKCFDVVSNSSLHPHIDQRDLLSMLAVENAGFGTKDNQPYNKATRLQVF